MTATAPTELAYLPTAAAAQARIAAVNPAQYARTRNALDGAATGLSPYITHGLVTLADVLAGVAAAHPLSLTDKFVFELGWREYFRHVWQHRGAAIFESLHEGPLPEAAYSRELPADVREARTGVPAIDAAVRTLYATGLLHNHARLWLASYLVHLRKVHWRTGADWMVAHLLDGDLASNHLSWQWVAGTGSSKPYLFNADNVARFAPEAWHSRGSAIDISYETLDEIARDASRVVGVPPRSGGAKAAAKANGTGSAFEPALDHAPPAGLAASAIDPALVRNRDVWLVHPWALRAPPADLPGDVICIGLWLDDSHREHPWSEARWAFAGSRMNALASACWHGSMATLAEALRGARSVASVDDPHLGDALRTLAVCRPAPRLFAAVDQPCASFSRWWSRATSGVKTLHDLPGLVARANSFTSNETTP
jgi:deoxyribodipyrimidine photo-lyase